MVFKMLYNILILESIYDLPSDEDESIFYTVIPSDV